MTFLVDHLPPQLHLVISTRADPALPLSRLRARGELVEIRAADLRFNADEVGDLPQRPQRLRPRGARHRGLEARTEGWVAALQLAALSLRDREDRSRFIAGFAGDDRFVVDYLVDEVLSASPTTYAASCSTPPSSTGSPGRCATRSRAAARHRAAAMLDLLDRQNLFLVPLDDHRRWYRYHHLFADVLHAHLLDERPGDVAELHRRASRLVRRRGTDRGRGPARARRPATSIGRRARRAGHPGPAARPARERHPPLGRRPPRGRGARPPGARGRAHRRADGQQRLRRRRPASA